MTIDELALYLGKHAVSQKLPLRAKDLSAIFGGPSILDDKVLTAAREFAKEFGCELSVDGYNDEYTFLKTTDVGRSVHKVSYVVSGGTQDLPARYSHPDHAKRDACLFAKTAAATMIFIVNVESGHEEPLDREWCERHHI